MPFSSVFKTFHKHLHNFWTQNYFCIKFCVLMSKYLLNKPNKFEIKRFAFGWVIENSLGVYFFMTHSVDDQWRMCGLLYWIFIQFLLIKQFICQNFIMFFSSKVHPESFADSKTTIYLKNPWSVQMPSSSSLIFTDKIWFLKTDFTFFR